MKKYLLLLALAACDDQVVTTTRHIVVLPEESMYRCQQFTNFPQGTITANQTARMLTELVQINDLCYTSQQTIRRFLEDARTRLAN